VAAEATAARRVKVVLVVVVMVQPLVLLEQPGVLIQVEAAAEVVTKVLVATVVQE
jgi:hypothetical protein